MIRFPKGPRPAGRGGGAAGRGGGAAGRGSLPAVPPVRSATPDAGGGTGPPCAAFPLQPGCERAGIGALRPGQLQPGQGRHGRQLDHRPCAHRAVQAGGMDVRQEDQARHVHQDMALAPKRLLGCIATSIRAACTRCPCRLRVDHGSGRLPISAILLASMLTQPVVHSPQRTVLTPAGKLRADGRLRRKVTRPHAPRTAGADQMKDGLGHDPARPLRRASEPTRWRKKRLQRRPFCVTQIRRIGSIRHGTLQPRHA